MAMSVLRLEIRSKHNQTLSSTGYRPQPTGSRSDNVGSPSANWSLKMYVIEWDFLPAAGREAQFVATYGPDGPWVDLFRQGSGYLGTELCSLPEKPGWFRTVDRWLSEQDYLAFRRKFAAEYAEIDSASETLTAFEVQVVQPRQSS
jgi:hypothetical protein